jgi:hypothetical protein
LINKSTDHRNNNARQGSNYTLPALSRVHDFPMEEPAMRRLTGLHSLSHLTRHFCALMLLVVTTITHATVHADTEVVERTASGTGATQAEATSAALVNAIQQVQGVGVDTARTLQTGFTQVLQAGPMGTSLSTSQQVLPVPTQARGYVESYAVTSAKQVGGNQWAVTVKAKVKKFNREQGTNPDLKTVAIAPFRRNNVPARYDDDVSRFVEELNSAVGSSGKFRILDRQFVSEYVTELGDLYSDTTHPEEALRLGQKLGADYLVVGNFDHFEMTERTVNAYGGNHPALIATGILHWRVIDVARREVRMVESLPLDSLGEVEAVNRTGYTQNIVPPQQQRLLATQQLRQMLAQAINRRMLEVLLGFHAQAPTAAKPSTPPQQTPATTPEPVRW